MTTTNRQRPEPDEYFMQIAMAVRKRANCRGSRVGAVLVLENRVVTTGYNGVPANMTNCEDGGCDRCSHPERYESGKGYDLCICVHGEQNALLSAARFGISIDGAVIYTTMRPCFGCTKELLQAGVKKVFYLHDWQHPDPEVQHQYALIQGRFPEGIHLLTMDDPDSAWAMPKRGTATPPAETGHPIPGNE